MEEGDYRTTYELEGSNWWFVGMRRICLELIARPPGGRLDGPILDVGCGTGIMLEHLDQLGPVVGLDRSAAALEFCEHRRRSSLVQGSGDRLPFADGTFALVSAFGVIEHIAADGDAMAEWARVVRPGGQVVLLTSAYRWLWSGHDESNHHVRRYRGEDVDALVRSAGLVPGRRSYVNTLLFLPIAAARVVERLVRRGRGFIPRKDTGVVPEPINRLFVGVLGVEARLVRRWRLPFGISYVVVATKPVGGGRTARVSSGTHSD